MDDCWLLFLVNYTFVGTSAWAAAAGTPNTNWAGQAYQNAMMQQGWGVMPAASGSAGASAQYQMGQYQPGANGQKS